MSDMTSAGTKAYMASMTDTATPGRVLVMCYERLIADLSSGADAIEDGEFAAANEKLLHAQDLLIELPSVIDMTGWPGRDGTLALYAWAHREAVSANTRKEAAQARAVATAFVPLLEAWREAVAAIAQSEAA